MTEDITLFSAEPVELTFDFEFTPAEITIKGKEELEQAIAAYAKKYDGYVVTAETFDDDAKVRAQINNLQKDIKSAVKDKLADYSKPLNEVNAWVNSITEPIAKIGKSIDEGVKKFEELERQKRANTIKETFETAIKESGEEIDIKLFSDEFDNLSAKGCFMADNIRVNTATKKIIVGLVADEVRKKKECEQALIKITEVAAKAGFGPASYVKNFKNGASLADVLQAIADDKTLADKVRAEEKAKRELSKRVEEMTVIAESKGLNPDKYVKMLEDGDSALEVHELLVRDAHGLVQTKQSGQDSVSKSAENRQKPAQPEQEMEQVEEYATNTQNGVETKPEPNKTVTKWQGDFIITFPNSEIAKAFGGKGGLYEQYGVTVEKVGDWRKL